MASQAEIINGINARTEAAAAALAAGGPRPGRWVFIFRLAFYPTLAFFWGATGGASPSRGVSRFQNAVNRWAESFLAVAKHYELSHADKGKAISESRDFV